MCWQYDAIFWSCTKEIENLIEYSLKNDLLSKFKIFIKFYWAFFFIKLEFLFPQIVDGNAKTDVSNRREPGMFCGEAEQPQTFISETSYVKILFHAENFTDQVCTNLYLVTFVYLHSRTVACGLYLFIVHCQFHCKCTNM